VTDKLPDLDPLRTFELEAYEWDLVKQAVGNEGFDAWDQYASSIVAAIELGYLDNHLQMLGLWLKRRYMHLKDSNSLPAMYAEGVSSQGKGKAVGVASVPVTSAASTSSRLVDGSWLDWDEAIEWVTSRHALINPPGIKPFRTADASLPLRNAFQVDDWVFSKDDFTNRYFTSPVPFRPMALFRIDKANRENFAVTCVAHKPRGRFRSEASASLGAKRNFKMDKQKGLLLDIPSN